MPKTRKKRGSSKKKKDSHTSKEDTKATNSDTDTKNTSAPRSEQNGEATVAVDFGDLSEADLKTELQSELKRLQDEYKRQKEITSELEHERDKILSSPSSATRPTTTELPSGLPETEYSATGFTEVYPEPRFDQPYLSDSDLEKRVMETVNTLKAEVSELKDQLKSKMDTDKVSELESNQELIDELNKSIKGLKKEINKIQKEVEKTDKKLSDVLLDLGFEESVDINKVPNYILVLVYETILNDIIDRIRHVMGGHDTEAAVNKTLESVRTHTSGGELFKYEHNKIKTPELRQYLDKKTISPKQIHITYNSVMNNLLEYVPDYSPKNFKAMIKIMSYEYALDTTAQLEERYKHLEDRIDDILKTMNKGFDKSKTRATELQMMNEEIKNMNLHLTKLSDRVNELPGLIDKQINERLSEVSLNSAIPSTSESESEESSKTRADESEDEPAVEGTSESDEPGDSEELAKPDIDPQTPVEVPEAAPEVTPEAAPETEPEEKAGGASKEELEMDDRESTKQLINKLVKESREDQENKEEFEKPDSKKTEPKGPPISWGKSLVITDDDITTPDSVEGEETQEEDDSSEKEGEDEREVETEDD